MVCVAKSAFWGLIVTNIKGGEMRIGVKASLRAIKEGSVSKLFVAKDAKKSLTQPLVTLAETNLIDTEYIASMKALGQLCQIDVGAAAAVIIKNKK